MPSSHGLLTTFGFQLGPEAPPHYALEGSIAVAGLGISWLKDNLRLIGACCVRVVCVGGARGALSRLGGAKEEEGEG